MKLIELTCVGTHWSANCKELLIESTEKHILINVDYIASISSEPVHAKEGCTIRDLYYVKTTIPVSLGINGVDYRSYYVTEATYLTLTTKLEIL